MHPNPVFRQTAPAEALALARARGFGVLAIAGPDGLLAAHVPFLLAEDGLRLEAHLVRSNPVAAALRAGPMAALLIVSGPDGYVSPDWYGAPDKVPTWNYVAVHLRGQLELLPDETLRPHLDRLSARFEAGLAPKTPWTSSKMSPGLMERMMRGILPVAMSVEAVESTVKLNQNRTAEEREGAAAGLAAGATPGLETARLAAMMRTLPG